ncbi:MAG: hypothetical protein E4H01_00335 [Lysobacterales bacterium]|nr:MAG: hypothetical protein E4H01_00335 [Xanthomonadales bacterium]
MSKVRPLTDEQIAEHQKFIDDLGGPTTVAALVEHRLDIELKRQSVSMWRRRGIPQDYRACLVTWAEELGVNVPNKFIDAGKSPPPKSEEVPFLE